MFRFRSSLIPALLLSLSIASFASGQTQEALYRFLIPEGYVGWIRVDFEVPDAPPLPVEGDFYILKFSNSGRLQTSSRDITEGWLDRAQFLLLNREILPVKVKGCRTSGVENGSWAVCWPRRRT